jgi:hypothetical protein
VLDVTPIDGPWKDASHAIGKGALVRAAEIIDGMGYAAGAAYARHRAAEALAAAGRAAEAAAQREQAEAFYRPVRATRFLCELEAPGDASEEGRRASSHG